MLPPDPQPRKNGKLTRRQAQVLDFIRTYSESEGLSPTLQEIGESLGINRVTVFEHVKELQKKGHLTTERNLSRSIELVSPPSASGAPAPVVAVLGRIAAGQPLDVVPEAERETFDARDLFPPGRDHFLLRVVGDSMIDDQIRDGDLVIVESRSHATAGETVVALIGDEAATLKRFYPLGREVRLEPRNASHSPICVPAQDVRIQGVVTGVIRQY